MWWIPSGLSRPWNILGVRILNDQLASNSYRKWIDTPFGFQRVDHWSSQAPWGPYLEPQLIYYCRWNWNWYIPPWISKTAGHFFVSFAFQPFGFKIHPWISLFSAPLNQNSSPESKSLLFNSAWENRVIWIGWWEYSTGVFGVTNCVKSDCSNAVRFSNKKALFGDVNDDWENRSRPFNKGWIPDAALELVKAVGLHLWWESVGIGGKAIANTLTLAISPLLQRWVT